MLLQIYLREANGSLTYLGRTEGSSFAINNPPNGKNTYIVKSAYSIFKNNMSDGLSITVTTNIEPTTPDVVTPTPTNPPTEDESLDLE